MSVPPQGVLLHTRYHAGSHGREPPYLSCSYTQACISLWGQAPLNMWLYQWNKKGGFTTDQLTNYFGHGFIWYSARDQNQKSSAAQFSGKSDIFGRLKMTKNILNFGIWERHGMVDGTIEVFLWSIILTLLKLSSEWNYSQMDIIQDMPHEHKQPVHLSHSLRSGLTRFMI